MTRLLLRWIILAVAIVVVGHIAKYVHLAFVVDADQATDWPRLLLGAGLLGLLNATLGPLLKLFTLPLNCLTFGLFSLVINGLMLMIASQAKLGFYARGFWPAVVAAILIAIVAGILNVFLPDPKK